MRRGFKGKRRANDPTYKPYDSNYHPQNLIELMSNGLYDCQIEDCWYISHSTFHRWRQENPELQDAYDIGQSKRKAYKIQTYLIPMMEGKLEGKHSFNAVKYVMDAELDYTKPAYGNNGTTNININNMAIINQKTIPELIEKLTNDMKFLEQNNIIPTEFKVLEHDSSESDEQNT